MSGFGERFRRAGYQMPKPLIEVDGKPIIEHVVNMFPGEEDSCSSAMKIILMRLHTKCVRF